MLHDHDRRTGRPILIHRKQKGIIRIHRQRNVAVGTNGALWSCAPHDNAAILWVIGGAVGNPGEAGQVDVLPVHRIKPNVGQGEADLKIDVDEIHTPATQASLCRKRVAQTLIHEGEEGKHRAELPFASGGGTLTL